MSNLLDLSAKISLDTSSYDKGLNDSSSKMSGFGDKLKNGLQTAAKVGAAALTAVAGAATAVSSAIVKITKETTEHADEVDKQSQKLGLSRQAYQEWDYVLSQAGVEITSMSTGLKTLTNKLDDAKNGGEESQKMFEKLGISLNDLQTMSREDIFKATIKGFQKMADSTDRAALANKLFGKSGQELTALFNETAESTDELIEKAHEYGMVMSDEAVQAGVDMQDSLDTLQKTFDGVKNNLASEFIPSFKTVVDGMTDLIAGKDGATEKISQGISDTIDLILEKTPELIDMVVPIIEGMAKSIIDNAPDLLSAGGEVIGDIIDKIPEAMEMITNFLETDSLPTLISDLCDTIIENIPEIIDAGVDLFSALLDNVEMIVSNLGDKIGPFLTSLVKKLTEPGFVTKIVEGGVDLLTHLIDDVGKIIDGITEGIWALINGIINLLTDENAMARLTLAGIKLGLALTKGIIQGLEKLNVLAYIPVIGDMFKGIDNLFIGAIDDTLAKIDETTDMLKQLADYRAEHTTETETGESVGGSYSGGGRSFTININGDVKAEDVADEIENRLAGKMAGAGVA